MKCVMGCYKGYDIIDVVDKVVKIKEDVKIEIDRIEGIIFENELK